jgi:hypothetical protein
MKTLSIEEHQFYHRIMELLIVREQAGIICEYDNARWWMICCMYYGHPFSDVELYYLED